MAGFNISDNLIVKNGSIGIGTSSPSFALDVIGEATVGNGTDGIKLSYSTGSNAGVIDTADTSDTLSIRTSNTERMRIDSSGRVGIGTTSPTQKLEVANGYGIFEGIKVGQNGTDIDSTFLGASSLLAFKLNGSEKMRIDSNGNVLVGKTTTSVSTAGTFIGGGGNDGLVEITRDGNYPLRLNRKTSDGQLLRFDKDGSIVGNAATYSGTVQFGQGNANLKFSNASDAITPANGTGTNNNNAIDLGSTSAKFKDGHFGGTVNANAFVGDGSGLTNISGGGSTGPAFFVKKHAGGSGPPQYITPNTYTKVTFTVEDIDTDSDFTNSRFTPGTAGYYWIHVNLFCAVGAGALNTAIYKNGSSQILSSYVEEQNYSAKGTASGLVYLNGSTDYVEAYVLLGTAPGSSSNASVQLNQSSYFTGFLAR